MVSSARTTSLFSNPRTFLLSRLMGIIRGRRPNPSSAEDSVVAGPKGDPEKGFPPVWAGVVRDRRCGFRGVVLPSTRMNKAAYARPGRSRDERLGPRATMMPPGHARRLCRRGEVSRTLSLPGGRRYPLRSGPPPKMRRSAVAPADPQEHDADRDVVDVSRKGDSSERARGSAALRVRDIRRACGRWLARRHRGAPRREPVSDTRGERARR